MLHRLENANRTGSEFSALVAQGVRLASLLGASGETMREVARSEGRKSSTDFAQAFNGGPYSANTLSGEMRGYVDNAHGITAAHVAGVGNYLHGLGINAQQYTGISWDRRKPSAPPFRITSRMAPSSPTSRSRTRVT